MKDLLRALFKRYLQDNVAQLSASLAYYMLFAFFPFLLLVGKILDLLGTPITVILENLNTIVPEDVLLIALQHMQAPYFGNVVAIVTWVVIAIYFFVRSINAFLFAIERAFSITTERHAARRFLLSLALALGNMLLLFVLIALIVAGKNLLENIAAAFHFSNTVLYLWHYGRFGLLAILIFGILYVLYNTAAVGQELQPKQLLPGAIAATISWLIISMCFSYYVSHIGRYSLLYGSLGAVIVLLLWLYLSSLIIVMGAELNGILRRKRMGHPGA